MTGLQRHDKTTEIPGEDLGFGNCTPQAARATEAVGEGCHCSHSGGPDRDPWEGKGLRKGILLLSCRIFSWGEKRCASGSFPLALGPLALINGTFQDSVPD